MKSLIKININFFNTPILIIFLLEYNFKDIFGFRIKSFLTAIYKYIYIWVPKDLIDKEKIYLKLYCYKKIIKWLKHMKF